MFLFLSLRFDFWSLILLPAQSGICCQAFEIWSTLNNYTVLLVIWAQTVAPFWNCWLLHDAFMRSLLKLTHTAKWVFLLFATSESGKLYFQWRIHIFAPFVSFCNSQPGLQEVLLVLNTSANDKYVQGSVGDISIRFREVQWVFFTASQTISRCSSGD